jgi:hypothetical protein
MDIIHQVTISQIPDLTKPTYMYLDAIKPKDAQRCFIAVDKLLGVYQVASAPAEIFEIFCSSVTNSYRYSGVSSSMVAVRSTFMDSFITSTIILKNNLFYACFNSSNSKENWLEIDISSINNIHFSFSSLCTQPTSSALNIQFKVKFQ